MVICGSSGGYPRGDTLMEHKAGESIKGWQHIINGSGITQKQPQFKVNQYSFVHFALLITDYIGITAGYTVMAKKAASR